jgi:hypothetical protein
MESVVKKKTLLYCILFMATIPLFGEEKEKEKEWRYALTSNLNISQVAMDNWVEGGVNAWSWQFNLAGKATQEKETFKWQNSGHAKFGKSKIGSADSRKAVDEINFESVYTRKIGFPINPYMAVTARTQFARGYSYTDTTKKAISDFLDPGYFTQSAGMGYQWKDALSTRLGASLKEAVTSDFPVPYADDPDTKEIEKTRIEFGAESVTDIKLSFSDNLLITSQLTLFTDFSAIKETDIDWENQLTATINKYMNVNFAFRLLYDRDLNTKRQIKEALAIGLTYNFF